MQKAVPFVTNHIHSWYSLFWLFRGGCRWP